MDKLLKKKICFHSVIKKSGFQIKFNFLNHIPTCSSKMSQPEYILTETSTPQDYNTGMDSHTLSHPWIYLKLAFMFSDYGAAGAAGGSPHRHRNIQANPDTGQAFGLTTAPQSC